MMTIEKLILIGYINGYERGHNDTIESTYTDACESGKDWLVEAIEDGGLIDLLEKYDLMETVLIHKDIFLRNQE